MSTEINNPFNIAKKMPSKERIEELFVADFAKGVLYRKASPKNNTSRTARAAGSTEKYSRVRIDGIRYSIHRILFFLATGFEPKMVDHINGDTTDNNLSNLRAVTNQQNQYNQSAKKPSSGYKNVIHIKASDKYAVRFKTGKKTKSFGHYVSARQAHLVATYQRWMFNGVYANHGIEA